ncbi:MAG: YcjX family protein [Rhizobiaceae bacterium]
MSNITNLTDDALIAFDNLSDMASNLVSPSIRLGITGLSRAGKTVFITSLVHNLIHGGRLPMFGPYASGRIAQAMLQPQPSMNVPRFAYEDHVQTLLEDHAWPKSTASISELRLTLKYESATAWGRTFGSGVLNIDMVDYPGEWLLDLPLLGMDFAQWSNQALELSRQPARKKLAAKWHATLAKVDSTAPVDETIAREQAQIFTQYLRDCREDKSALSTLPPGRFLMPGDLEGSPALTFAPLDIPEGAKPEPESLHALMQDRFEAYKTIVIKPFFREHFARLDRQIVLVDALQAINAGPEAIQDLEIALGNVLACFRPGSGHWLTSVLSRKIDKILFAATKADHLHHENHDRLEALLSRLVEKAITRAKFAGADVDVQAIASIRATQEGYMGEGKDKLPVVIGKPLKDQVIDGEKFDGRTKTAIFPGDLPKNPSDLFSNSKSKPNLTFVRFKPPELETSNDGLTLSLPHIRLDRALQFLLADRLA